VSQPPPDRERLWCCSSEDKARADAHLLSVERERDLLRAKLTAHHAIHHMAEWDVARWAASTANKCPVCQEVEAGQRPVT